MSNIQERFEELIAVLSKITETKNARGAIFKSFDKLLLNLESSGYSLEDFKRFLFNLHDRLVQYDTVFRIYGYRAIRHFLKTPQHIHLLFAEV